VEKTNPQINASFCLQGALTIPTLKKKQQQVGFLNL
jgi:hypothetical protein